MAWVSFRRSCGAAVCSAALATAAASAQTERPGQLPTLPLTQLDEQAPAADLDNRTFSLTFAQPLQVNDLLVLLVRGTTLSIVPDPAIRGTFIGELKNVTVRQALSLILDPLGLDYAVDGTLIRVFRREPETRIFEIDYSIADRVASARVGRADDAGTASLASTSHPDVFGDLNAGIRALLSDRGTFSVDRKAGVVQVTDYPERLDRVAAYLDVVQERAQRQAQVDAQVIEIELTDEKAPGVDWRAIARAMAERANGAAAPRAGARASLTGLRVTDLPRLMTALESQGKVAVVASPRWTTLNNEPALVRTESLTLGVTAQISGESIVTLSVSPIVTIPAVAQSDLLARVADGETLVISGFIRDRETRERKAMGVSGGWFGRGTVVTRKRVELAILLTPKIVSGVMAQ